MYVVYLEDEKIKNFHHPKNADAYAHFLETQLKNSKSAKKVTIKKEQYDIQNYGRSY